MAEGHLLSLAGSSINSQHHDNALQSEFTL